MKIRPAAPASRCSIVVSVSADRKCGAPGVVEFDGRNGDVLVECADHALASDLAELAARAAAPVEAPVSGDYRLPSGNRSASRAGFYLVDHNDVIRGYAESDGPAVAKRASRLGARIVRNPRFA